MLRNPAAEYEEKQAKEMPWENKRLRSIHKRKCRRRGKSRKRNVTEVRSTGLQGRRKRPKMLNS